MKPIITIMNIYHTSLREYLPSRVQGLSVLYLYAASVAKHDGALMVRSPVCSAVYSMRPWATGTVKAYLCQRAAVRPRWITSRSTVSLLNIYMTCISIRKLVLEATHVFCNNYRRHVGTCVSTRDVDSGCFPPGRSPRGGGVLRWHATSCRACEAWLCLRCIYCLHNSI